MRVAHVIIIAATTILTFPRPTSAGIWSWFDKPGEDKKEEKDAPTTTISTEDAPTVAVVETTLPVDTSIQEDTPIVETTITDEEHDASIVVETPPPQTPQEDYTTTNNVEDPLLSNAREFGAWFRTNGGTVDDRITIGYEPGTTLRGLIATAPIPADTILIYTPPSLIISGSDPNDKCQVIEIMKNEMRLGTESKWHTYFEFDDASGSHLPMNWHELLDEMQGLPPRGDSHNHLIWYRQACLHGQEDDDIMSEVDWRALGMYLTRAADIGMVPVYDLMNFNNGKINTRLQRDENGGLSVVSLMDIPAGTPIYNSCSRGGWKSSDHIFNDYGYVEDYPQLWRWTDDEWHQLSQEEWDNAYANNVDYEPNVPAYEVLVVSPTLAAISPSKQLVSTIGHEQRSLEEWQRAIDAHHANVRASRARAIRAVARILDMLPTTIEEDEVLFENMVQEKRSAADAATGGGEKSDILTVIEYRLAFKKALRLTIEVIDREWERFYVDKEEL